MQLSNLYTPTMPIMMTGYKFFAIATSETPSKVTYHFLPQLLQYKRSRKRHDCTSRQDEGLQPPPPPPSSLSSQDVCQIRGFFHRFLQHRRGNEPTSYRIVQSLNEGAGSARKQWHGLGQGGERGGRVWRVWPNPPPFNSCPSPKPLTSRWPSAWMEAL